MLKKPKQKLLHVRGPFEVACSSILGTDGCSQFLKSKGIEGFCLKIVCYKQQISVTSCHVRNSLLVDLQKCSHRRPTSDSYLHSQFLIIHAPLFFQGQYNIVRRNSYSPDACRYCQTNTQTDNIGFEELKLPPPPKRGRGALLTLLIPTQRTERHDAPVFHVSRALRCCKNFF